MPWDIWALLAIVALCGAVIAWSGRGWYRERRESDSGDLYLPLNGGGHLFVARPVGPSGRHRIQIS